MNKTIKDGKVAVLYSPGYGAGWSTWASECEQCLFDPETVDWVLNDKKDPPPDWKEKFGECFYDGGSSDLEVIWVPIGTAFRIDEYDGSESISFSDTTEWIVA